MDSILSKYWNNQNLEIDIYGFLISICASIFCAILVKLMYRAFYTREDGILGANTTFLIIAPSVTAIFLAIQFSLPLSLGLLGALSFIRFRTPIKDPEEIAYLLLVIACSIGSATFNFEVVFILLGVINLMLVVYHFLIERHLSGRKSHSMVVSLNPQIDFSQKQLEQFLIERNLLPHIKNISEDTDRTHLHYSLNGKKTVDFSQLAKDIKGLSEAVMGVNILRAEP